jgi:hypothetical protein
MCGSAREMNSLRAQLKSNSGLSRTVVVHCAFKKSLQHTDGALIHWSLRPRGLSGSESEGA